jgi:hypothetical protein
LSILFARARSEFLLLSAILSSAVQVKLYIILIAIIASAELVSQINRIAAAINFVLTITAAVLVDEYAKSADYMRFDNEKKREMRKKI